MRCKEGDAIRVRYQRGEKEDVHVGEGISQRRKEEKKRKDELVDCSVAHTSQKGAARADSAFVNERGSQCTYEGKGAVSGEKEKKRKSQTRWQGRRACGFKKKGDPLTCK